MLGFKKYRKILIGLGMLLLKTKSFSQDPNFYVFLCFGQSNMEGQGPIETQDKTVDSRFQVLEALTCSGLNRTQGQWYTAVPPLVRCDTKLGPADYFGRTMVDSLPSNIKIGVVDVAVAGCDIALFDKVNYASYAASAPSYMQTAISQYGGNPYGRLVEMAKIAQKTGVIKGILMHQGETNSGQSDWPQKVKAVYQNLLADLGLNAADVPLLVGEVLQGGSCSGHNTIIATVPSVIPTAHVVSSTGCTGQSDNLHFTSAGYRILGARYAQVMLPLLKKASGPSVSITSPSATSFAAPATIPMTATATTTTGSITKVEFYNGKILLGTATSSPYSFSWTNVPVGIDTLTAVATDNTGNKATSSSVIINVVNAFKIFKTATPITIDGSIDAEWTNANVLPVSASKLLSGTVTNAADLSGTIKALWDNSYLYVLSEISDDALKNDSQNSYDDDGVEVYVDVNNDKATSYGTNDRQFTFGWNDGTTVGVLPSGSSTTGITYSAVAKTGGYIVEARIPWSTVTGNPAVGQLVGFDFMINDDDDGTGRDGKLSWNAAVDSAWTKPTFFGTAQLMDVPVCSTPAAPDVTSPVEYALNASASALSATGSNLLWYTTASGGTGLSIAPTPKTSSIGTVTYYVSQTIGGCESSRSAIIVNVKNIESVSLVAGWNMVGCPLDGSTPLKSALSSIWNNVEMVKDQDVFYSTANNSAFNLLKTVEWGKGYMVKVTVPCTLDWIVK